ncbi:MAG: sigma-70 family RNA polymerase sigma factor [Roseiflexus sp.]|jgi:RNA polymerase sigma-70 factor (ECF subfamily)|nr:sigma-70 family RNA polymerase sigma factor [Roseiflexus sp.]MBO9363819.1 sigma-70 family RNA polymerase sigma factor [Roseiflexus sp.]MBO9381030.1 sigma-70 family RNA polymerase sigma factor [Roseiflexus sp.]MBO9387389.1 sigma-70 family RNA polymerase sigma factor [Roseiflexus sp.]
MVNQSSDEYIRTTTVIPRTDTPDDHVLIAAIAQGDSSALETLYDRYSSVVYRMALRMLKNRELAEEVVQEVFWRVWRRSASFDIERGRVAQWLFGIAHNLCIDELRRMRARPTQVYEDVDHPVIQQLADDQIDVPEAAWAFEQRRVIRDALDHLPDTQREAVELAYFGGLSHQEIATKLNRPLGTIKTRVRLGLQKLGALLTARGLQPGDAS